VTPRGIFISIDVDADDDDDEDGTKFIIRALNSIKRRASIDAALINAVHTLIAVLYATRSRYYIHCMVEYGIKENVSGGRK
jgi:hypothetical protein